MTGAKEEESTGQAEGWEAGCQSRGLVTLVLDKLNTILIKKKRIVVYG